MPNEELFELELRSEAEALAAGQTDLSPVPTQAELRAMSCEALTATSAQIRAEMAAERRAVSSETPPTQVAQQARRNRTNRSPRLARLAPRWRPRRRCRNRHA
jgi:hypothetical protein